MIRKMPSKGYLVENNMNANTAILRESPVSPPLPNLLNAGWPASAPENHSFRQLHAKDFLETLLLDRRSGKGIFWATETYSDLGAGFGKQDAIRRELSVGRHKTPACIRKDRRLERTRKHGEVATPLPLCKTMCDYAYSTLRAGTGANMSIPQCLR